MVPPLHGQQQTQREASMVSPCKQTLESRAELHKVHGDLLFCNLLFFSFETPHLSFVKPAKGLQELKLE